MAKDTYYFSHDYNSRNDIKIKKLISKHGYLGYGLFWALIEELYNNTNVLRLDYDTISFDLRCDIDTIKSIINDFDLFVFEEDTFGSLSVERRLNERNEKSAKARESVLKRWNKLKENTNVLQMNNDSNTIKESKGKKEKEKEQEKPFSFKQSLIDFGFTEQLVSDWIKVRKEKKASNTETAYKNFINEIEKRQCDINKVLEFIVSKSWSGFKWEWYDKEAPQTTSKKSTFVSCLKPEDLKY